MRKINRSLIKLKIQRLCRPITTIIDRIITLFSFPHIWICLIILLLAVISLYASYQLNIIEENYWSSILANIAAGFVTGIVICLVGGAKQISVTKIKLKLAWLDKISEMVTQYNSSYSSLMQLHFDKFDGSSETFDFIYTVGSHANWINEEILQRSFDKTLLFDSIKYCSQTLGYDALALANDFEELHEKLRMIDFDCPSSNEIKGYFSKVERELRQLRSAIYTEKKKLEIRLSEIQNTII